MSLIRRLLIGLAVVMMAPLCAFAQTGSNVKIEELQTEMYKLFYREDSLQFRQVVNELKEECEKAGNEEVFYKAWGNYAIYESTHQRRTQALALAKEMESYAVEHKSIFGQYTAMHVLGSVYHQMRDYDNAEKTFKEAIDFLHKNSPSQSASADYIELVLISINGRSDVKQGMAYAEKALHEPNVSAQHRMRVLTMLCQLEGEKPSPNKDVFNKYYEERLQARAGTPADRAEATVNMLYHFVNGDYQKALDYSDSLSTGDQITYAKARIYHKLGDDARAYQQMLAYKSVKDSMNRAERTGLLSEYIVQLNNERLSLANMELERQNSKLRNWFAFTLIALVILLIVMASTYIVRRLRHQNAMLGKANQEEHEARMAEAAARKQAEKEVAVKREFMANVAKELRSPLNPITGFSDILAATDMELSAEEREMMSQHIKENSKLLTTIIDRMVELAFYESAQTLPKVDEFSPNVLCQNAYDYANMHQVKEGVEINFRTELNDTVSIRSDFQDVDKVVRELLGNACKNTDKGAILLTCQEKDGYIRFMVSDTGSGIPAERAQNIFEPFAELGKGENATGMGLAICGRIASLLDGHIWLDETYKKGSRFIFEIPKE